MNQNYSILRLHKNPGWDFYFCCIDCCYGPLYLCLAHPSSHETQIVHTLAFHLTTRPRVCNLSDASIQAMKSVFRKWAESHINFLHARASSFLHNTNMREGLTCKFISFRWICLFWKVCGFNWLFEYWYGCHMSNHYRIFTQISGISGKLWSKFHYTL